MSMDSLREIMHVYEEYWEKEEELYVMPNTIRARAYLQKAGKDITILGILDNDESQNGSSFCDIPIYYAEKMLESDRKKKILVSAHYREVAEQLNALGYKEYIDYIDMHVYVSMWYWTRKREIHLLDVHTAITTYCSLNCANCNMFLNHYKPEQRMYYTLQQLQADYDALFEVVDYCYKVTLLGGEPLLNQELAQMLRWLKDRYGEKIGEIDIVSNGTILPKQELLDVIKETDTVFQLSNYALNEKYKEKMAEIERLLIDSQVNYRINQEMKWKDFYFPRAQQGAKFASYREHMLCCNPVFRGLNDKKFYYCHIVWSAEQAGLWIPSKEEYIQLQNVVTEDEKERFLAYDLGFVESGYVTLCKVCGGCGVDNMTIIDAGIQE